MWLEFDDRLINLSLVKQIYISKCDHVCGETWDLVMVFSAGSAFTKYYMNEEEVKKDYNEIKYKLLDIFTDFRSIPC